MGRKLKVVIADDNADARFFLAAAIVELDHHFYGASSTAEAVELVHYNDPGFFDLVMCAMYFIPGPNPSDGLSVMEACRTHDPSLKFVLMDDHTPSLTREIAEEAGADGFLEKEKEWTRDYLRKLDKLLRELFPD